MKQSLKDKWANDKEFYAKMLETYNSKESLERRSNSARLAWSRKSTRKKHVAGSRRSRTKAVETRRKNYPNGAPGHGERMKEYWSIPKNREAQSKRLIAAWNHPKKGKNLRNGLYKSGPRWRTGMTKPEKQVYKLLKDLGYSYKWTGGGKGRILSYVPDFTHTRFKRVIEYYGEYWHKDNDPRDKKRIREIKNEGYKVLVIKQKDLKNQNKLIQKIRCFHK